MGALVMGIVYVLIGLSIRVYPAILAGYSNLSQRDRENAEKNGLPFYGLLLFCTMGALIFASIPVSIWVDQPNLPLGVSVIVSLIGMIAAIVGGNLMTNNRLK